VNGEYIPYQEIVIPALICKDVYYDQYIRGTKTLNGCSRFS